VIFVQVAVLPQIIFVYIKLIQRKTRACSQGWAPTMEINERQPIQTINSLNVTPHNQEQSKQEPPAVTQYTALENQSLTTNVAGREGACGN
jgi:hypothetical protein